jgi:uncharacterized protein (DUF2062 family)/precorrin-6B methylase 2
LSPGRAAVSVGVGLFVGSLPLPGAQLAIVLAVCLPLGLDAAVAYLAAHVSNPFTLTLFVAAELEVGSVLLTGRHAAMSIESLGNAGLGHLGSQILVGSLVVGAGLSTLGGTVTWLIAHRAADARLKTLTDARKHTLERYASSPRAVRTYVAIKLRTDPALGAIARLDGHFGRVVDAGCGFGQIGLCLTDLGRTSSLVGIDEDPERIEAFARASEQSATSIRARLRESEFPAADTFLFVDSLHYLPLADQDIVLERAVASLAPGGRIVIREVSSGASIRSSVTEWLERRAARKSGRDQRAFGFRSASSLTQKLTSLGLTCTVAEHDELSIVHNVLIVGTKPAER